MPPAPKSAGAFRTIGELSRDTGLPQHILRYWETRFAQLKPLQRAGNRRYYRPEDVALVKRIDGLLNREGYTVRGVQQLLDQGERLVGLSGTEATPDPLAEPAPALAPALVGASRDELFTALSAIRALLVGALKDDGG